MINSLISLGMTVFRIYSGLGCHHHYYHHHHHHHHYHYWTANYDGPWSWQAKKKCMWHWQWLMSVLCVRNLNNTKKRQENEVCCEPFVSGDRPAVVSRRCPWSPLSPWTNRSRAHFTMESDGESLVCILSAFWWSHWLWWGVSSMRSMASDGGEEMWRGGGAEQRRHILSGNTKRLCTVQPPWSQLRKAEDGFENHLNDLVGSGVMMLR